MLHAGRTRASGARVHRTAPRLAGLVCGAAGLACAVASLALVLACGSGSPSAPDAGWPAGALLSAQRAPLLRILDQLAQLESTPLARIATDLRARLPDCDEIEAHAPAGARDLPAALRCAEPSGPAAGLRRYRGDDPVALAIPVGDGPRVLLRAREDDGGLRASLRWPDESGDAALAGLLPGAEPAGPPVLTGAERVLQARVRSRELDVAALVPEGSQGDQLFHLRSELFAEALLDGTWELGVYAPLPGARMPRVALALGVRLRSAAEAGVARLLDELERSWSLHHTSESFPDPAGRVARGACLRDLRLLPELAPCAVATDRALVLGWNAQSLRHALSGGELAETDADAPALARLDLRALERADRELALAAGSAAGPVLHWPWDRALARAERRGDATALWLELESAREAQHASRGRDDELAIAREASGR